MKQHIHYIVFLLVVILMSGCAPAAPAAPEQAPPAPVEEATPAPEEEVVTVVVEVGEVELEKVVGAEATVEVAVEVEVMAESEAAEEAPPAMAAAPARLDEPVHILVLYPDHLEAYGASGWPPAATLDVVGQASVHANDEWLILSDQSQVRVLDRTGYQPQGAIPIQGQVAITSTQGRLVVAHEGWTGLFYDDGTPIANIPTDGPADIRPLDGRLCLVDRQGVRTVDLDGNALGSAIPCSEHDAVAVIGDRFVVAREGWTGVYDLDGGAIATIDTSGRARITVAQGHFVLADALQARIYDLEGNQAGDPIPLPSPATITTVADRLVLAHQGWAAFYDLTGRPLASVSTGGQADVVPAAGRVLLVNGPEARVHDLNGNQLGQGIPVAQPFQYLLVGDRLVVVHDTGIGIYALDGWPIATLNTTGRAQVQRLDNAVLVRDDAGLRFFDLDGSQVGQVAPVARSDAFAALPGRIAIAYDEWVGLYDLGGNQLAAIDTAGRAAVDALADRLVVGERDAIRIYDLGGMQVGEAIPIYNPMAIEILP